MNVGSWIPQLFYDVIGRIAPGAALLTLGLAIALGASDFNGAMEYLFADLKASSYLVLIVWLLASYVIGMLFSAFGFLFDGAEWKIVPDSISLELPNGENPEGGASYMYDAVQYYSPSSGLRLAKLSAEVTMGRVLIVGIVLLVIIHIVANHGAWQSLGFWLILISALLAGVGACCLRRHISIRRRRMLVNCWHLIGGLERINRDRIGNQRSPEAAD